MYPRRQFIAKSATLFAGIQILPRSLFGANSPNERLNIAFVGAGGKGWHAIRSLADNPLVNFTAFADVDERRCIEARKAHPNIPFFSDFRAMLDRHGKVIDGVVISTPDHTHHYNAKWCLKSGKHVYLEKPLTHNIAEARDLMALETSTRLACQMGNQGHSGGGIPMLSKWVETGILGEVKEAHAWSDKIWSHPDRQPPGEPLPAAIGWEQWIGPAAMVPYSSEYMPGKWRGWFAFGTGTLGDWACHNMDAPYTVWDLDCPSRVEIESSGASKLSFPETAKITFTFPTTRGRVSEFKINWYHGRNHAFSRPPELEESRALPAGGTFIRGSKAAVLMGTHAGTPRVIPEVKMKELAPDLPKVELKRSSHWDNWLLAIKGQEKTRSNFAYAGRLTETMHFANIALHVSRSLTIDPKSRSILGDSEAASLMSGQVSREGWRI